MLEVTKIYSIAGMLPPGQPLIRQRPFRAPHHTVSHAGLVGGGRVPRPGEITLAHRGVLFLDELPEFSGAISGNPAPTSGRSNSNDYQGEWHASTYPANFVLIGAMNCPCGYYGDPVKECTCSSTMIARYQKKISGPLLDRIDIHVEVPRVEYEKLADNRLGETSSAIGQGRSSPQAPEGALQSRGRRELQRGDAPRRDQEFCELDAAGQSLIKAAMRQLHLSARAYHRILKLSDDSGPCREREDRGGAPGRGCAV